MNRELRVRPMLSRSTATISDEYSAVPTDFLGVRSFALDSADLAFVDVADIDDAATDTTAAGKPTRYSVVGAEFRFFPAPDADYASVLTYWAKIPALSDDNPTNWLLTAHPDAYLYGAILHYAAFNRDADLMATAGPAFAAALDAIRANDISESFGDRRRLLRQGF
jgi:hypothetical protein